MLFLWPQVAWHALRPGDLFRVPQPLCDGNCKMQVYCGLCCVWPLAGEDKHTGVSMSVHWPFGHGSSTSDGTHSRRWSDVPEPSQCTPILSSLTQPWHWVCVLKENGSLWCLVQIWHRSHWFWYVYAGFTLVLPRMAFGLFGSHSSLVMAFIHIACQMVGRFQKWGLGLKCWAHEAL